MSDGLVIVPGNGTAGYVQLARSKQGRIFKKEILKYGDLLYPGVAGGKVTINDEFADTLITNFSNKVCDIVQVPTAGDNNEHSEDPNKNIGEVIGLSKENGSIYAHIDARKPEAADALGKTLLGASAMMHMNYTDTRTGKTVGPTLLHVAVTNRPYVTDLKEYQEIGEVIAASADGKGGAVVLTASHNPKEKKMSTLDELLAELRTDHGIDVPALQEQASRADQGVALSNKITETLGAAGILKLSNGTEASVDDVVEAIANVHSQNVELSNTVKDLQAAGEKNAAEARVDSLVKEGRILPKNKDAQVRLLLSNSELFEELLPEKPLVKLSNVGGAEQGFETVDDSHDKTVGDEIARLSASVGTVAPGIIKV